ncbi:MAG: DUF2271 domain-containing protein [Proteobacteria bacterium]|nr:DUF2271 domain-containing protein [Pseudomonadota bacterium]
MSTIGPWFLLGACFERRFDPDLIGDGTSRPTDLFTIDAAPPPPCGGQDPSPLTALQITVRTSPVGGRFAPRNVGAIWIEDAAGTFVKTVARWGTTRAKWLLRWNAASRGDVADAITGATLTSHTTHAVSWDLTDLDRCEVPTGDYQVVMEHTDRDGSGASLATPFHKDQEHLLISPPDDSFFHDITLNLN